MHPLHLRLREYQRRERLVDCIDRPVFLLCNSFFYILQGSLIMSSHQYGFLSRTVQWQQQLLWQYVQGHFSWSSLQMKCYKWQMPSEKRNNLFRGWALIQIIKSQVVSWLFVHMNKAKWNQMITYVCTLLEKNNHYCVLLEKITIMEEIMNLTKGRQEDLEQGELGAAIVLM